MADEEVKGPVDSGLLQADRVVEAEAKKTEPTKTEPAKAAPVVADDAAGDDDDHGESAGDEGEQQPAGEPGKKNTPRGVQKKLDKLTREKYQAQQEAQYWRERAEKKGEPPANPEKPDTAAAPEGKPTLEAFEYDQEKFLEALSDWKVEQKLAAAEQRRVQSEKAKAASETMAGWASREQAFIAENPDYAEVAYTAPINYSDTMLDFVKESEIGPQIAYHLGSHLDEAKAIEQMSPTRQAAALARLEMTLSPAGEAADPATPRPTRTITKAPPPPATVTPSGGAKRSPSDPNLSTAERIALWRRKTA